MSDNTSTAGPSPALPLRQRLGYHPLLLGLVALAASGALSLVSSLTRGPIAEAEATDLRNSLSEVLPAGYADNDFLSDTVRIERDGAPLTIYRARREGAVQAAMFRVSGRGYGGEIALLMAVDGDGRTLGVRVLRHTETPGLGDKIEAAKSDWITRFNGRSLGDPAPARWAVRKDGGDFDQFAGATITPRAVVKAVREGLDFLAANRERIFGDRP